MPFEIAYEDGARSRAVALFGGDGRRSPRCWRRTARGWAFDQEGTIAAMRERRIGVNEANAIRALRALAQAQERFRVSDRTGDGVLQYAAAHPQHPGAARRARRRRGIVPGPSMDLLNEAFARAEASPVIPAPDPQGGYAYRILPAQGPHAEGGARSYLASGG